MACEGRLGQDAAGASDDGMTWCISPHLCRVYESKGHVYGRDSMERGHLVIMNTMKGDEGVV